MKVFITFALIIFGILWTLGIIIPTLKDSLTNYDLNRQKHFIKITWSLAQLIAICYVITRRFSKNK